MAHPDTICSWEFRVSIELFSCSCTFSWAAQVFAHLRQCGIALPIANGAPAAVASFALPHASSASRQAAFQLCRLVLVHHLLLMSCAPITTVSLMVLLPCGVQISLVLVRSSGHCQAAAAFQFLIGAPQGRYLQLSSSAG